MPIKSFQRKHLVRLARLHRRGLLSEAEYVLHKTQLLCEPDVLVEEESKMSPSTTKRFVFSVSGILVLLLGINYSVNSNKAKISFAKNVSILRNSTSLKAAALTGQPTNAKTGSAKVLSK